MSIKKLGDYTNPENHIFMFRDIDPRLKYFGHRQSELKYWLRKLIEKNILDPERLIVYVKDFMDIENSDEVQNLLNQNDQLKDRIGIFSETIKWVRLDTGDYVHVFDRSYIQAKFKLIDNRWQIHGRNIQMVNYFDTCVQEGISEYEDYEHLDNQLNLCECSFKKSTPIGVIKVQRLGFSGNPVSESTYFTSDFQNGSTLRGNYISYKGYNHRSGNRCHHDQLFEVDYIWDNNKDQDSLLRTRFQLYQGAQISERDRIYELFQGSYNDDQRFSFLTCRDTGTVEQRDDFGEDHNVPDGENDVWE